MTSTANDPPTPMASVTLDWDMTVLELAVLLAAHRAKRPQRFDDVRETVASWFECPIPRRDLSRAVLKMGARGWLVAEGDKLMPAEMGRWAACTRGTGLIDVALMMAVLRLAREELERGDLHH